MQNWRIDGSLPSREYNRLIRERAAERVSKGYWRYVAASAAMFVFSLPSIVAQTVWVQVGPPVWILSRAVSLLAFPLSVGVSACFYAAFEGGAPDIGEIFRFYTPKRRFFTALLLGLTQMVLSELSVLPDYLMRLVPENNIGLIEILSGLGLAALGASIYLAARIFPLSYVFIKDNGRRMKDIISECFKVTRGRVTEIAVFVVGVAWKPFLGALVVLVALSAALANPDVNSVSTRLLIQAAAFGVVALFAPYMNMAIAGYARLMLEPGEDRPQDSAAATSEDAPGEGE